MEKDDELEKIRQKKIREMMKMKETKGSLNMDGKVIEVTDLNFQETIKKSELAVIDCWAAWCAPCRMIAPVIEELAKDYAGRILFGKLNVDLNRKIAQEQQIMSIPTILIFKQGLLVDRVVGALPKKTLESRITQHL
jgi:thioredoxin 1